MAGLSGLAPAGEVLAAELPNIKVFAMGKHIAVAFDRFLSAAEMARRIVIINEWVARQFFAYAIWVAPLARPRDDDAFQSVRRPRQRLQIEALLP